MAGRWSARWLWRPRIGRRAADIAHGYGWRNRLFHRHDRGVTVGGLGWPTADAAVDTGIDKVETDEVLSRSRRGSTV